MTGGSESQVSLATADKLPPTTPFESLHSISGTKRPYYVDPKISNGSDKHSFIPSLEPSAEDAFLDEETIKKVKFSDPMPAWAPYDPNTNFGLL